MLDVVVCSRAVLSCFQYLLCRCYIKDTFIFELDYCFFFVVKIFEVNSSHLLRTYRLLFWKDLLIKVKMDITVPFQLDEANEKSYTRDELRHIISHFRATTRDYLLQTFFHTHNITEGPLFTKYRRRFNNLIFNNLSQIMSSLTQSVFYPRNQQILQSDLAPVKYLSCIFPLNLKTVYFPIFVQFFNPKKGIEHRLLDYTCRASEVVPLLVQHGVIDRVIGYCGDYRYRDPGDRNCTSDHFTSLHSLSKRDILDLPYSDGFINALFNLLVGYLPNDLTKSLIDLGDTLAGMSGKSHLVHELVFKYKEWLKSGQHILLSRYATFVIENLEAINSYLVPFECLPDSIGILFSSVLNRFMLVFLVEIYTEVHKIKLTDNSAIVYYFYLFRIRDMFKHYIDINYKPTKADSCLNDQINSLVELKRNDSASSDTNLKEIELAAIVIVDYFYARAVAYIEPLLQQFSNFEIFFWALLNTIPVDALFVQETYSVIHRKKCDNLEQLLDEVRILNLVISKLQLTEIDGVVDKWIRVLEECHIPMIEDLLEYLLALPASYHVMECLESHSQEECCEKAVRMNLKVEMVDKIEEVVGEYWDVAEEIVREKQILTLED